MAVKCVLSCKNPNQRVDLNLSDSLKDMSSIDFSKCTAVFEDGSYGIYFICDQYMQTNIKLVEVCVNGEIIGNIVLNKFSSHFSNASIKTV